MTISSAPVEAGFARQRLVRLRPEAWADLVKTREDLRREPILADWATRGWPLVVRRRLPEDGGDVPLGLPLPASHGRRRLSLAVAPAAVLSDAPPLPLLDCRGTAPASWRPTIDAILALAGRRGADVRCFGSLAWSALTGLTYLSPTSDLDLLLAPGNLHDAAALVTDLAAVEERAPMRLDGEIVRADGAATHWRELHAAAGDVLVKTGNGIALWTRARFLESAA